MASFRSRVTEASRAAAERRQREDSAPRLRAEVSALETLKLQLEELRQGASVPETVHVKHVAVEHAPALFHLPCLDSSCEGGGHDVTSQILAALRSKKARFQGEHACNGMTRAVGCTRVLRYVGHATYTDGSAR
jgi:hypothetical protein